MKLTAINANPSLKSSNKKSFSYDVTIAPAKKATTFSSMVEAVHHITSTLLEKKKLTVEELNKLNPISSYELLLEVTDVKDDEQIKKLLKEIKWNGRYSMKLKVSHDKKQFLVCREWTEDRLKKLAGKLDGVTVTKKDA